MEGFLRRNPSSTRITSVPTSTPPIGSSASKARAATIAPRAPPRSHSSPSCSERRTTSFPREGPRARREGRSSCRAPAPASASMAVSRRTVQWVDVSRSVVELDAPLGSWQPATSLGCKYMRGCMLSSV